MEQFTIEKIASFWQKNPCGSDFVTLTDWENFFTNYDKFKYSIEPHILTELSKIDFKGKRVLEIGLGQGAEAQRIIESGAIYNGIDLTEESVKRVKLRCEIFNLPYESIAVNNAENINFPDSSFDIVFSHGVIHHSPRIKEIVDEIYRVLKPGGMFVIMLYHRNSVNYQISIKIIRRIGIFLLFIPGISKLISKLTNEPIDRLVKHRDNLKSEGLKYLRINNFIHKATDGPENVYSSVFNEKEAKELFARFKNLRFDKFFFNERQFPIIRNFISSKLKNKIATRYGWHLWCRGIK
jgi:ubiquinone/menaquinone biosynthesis C-methylase UbiE